jgi:acyl-[acyl-carrier-protein] desaturase
MTILSSPSPLEAHHHETREKFDILRELTPLANELMHQHNHHRRDWSPNDFLPADEQMSEDQEENLAKLRERARSIPDPARVAICVNLITEEGLPHFHRLISAHLGDESVWGDWNFLWTAEEDRHGCLLRDYTREARIFKYRHVEMMQFAYLRDGFTPSWDKDPYKVFVYTTLQERATQWSHFNTGKLVSEEEPLLFGILKCIAGDESKHFMFYRKVFKAILDIDPNRALESALAIMPAIDMPGLTMPNFKEMADVVRRVGIYGPWDYKKIVEEAIEHWKIETLTGLNDAGRQAQEKIMMIPKRLQKIAEYLDYKSKKKSFDFNFIYNREFALE